MHLLCLLKPKGLRGSITCFVFPSKKNRRELMNFWSKDGILIRLFLKKTVLERLFLLKFGELIRLKFSAYIYSYSLMLFKEII